MTTASLSATLQRLWDIHTEHLSYSRLQDFYERANIPTGCTIDGPRGELGIPLRAMHDLVLGISMSEMNRWTGYTSPLLS